jgi:DTW domain-containing protein YfiP
MHFASPASFCVHCRFHQEICLCHHVRRVDPDLRLIVVLHIDEVRKTSNTGRLAKLVVPDCRIAVHGPTAGPRVDLSELAETHDATGRPWRTLLFYPGMGAEPLTPELAATLRAPMDDGARPRLRLVVPDGTWSQARRLVKRLPELSSLPRVILPVTEASVSRADIRPRTNHDNAQRVSTCEAIATAVGMLGSPEAEAALLAVYDQAALRIGRQRGKFASQAIV